MHNFFYWKMKGRVEAAKRTPEKLLRRVVNLQSKNREHAAGRFRLAGGKGEHDAGQSQPRGRVDVLALGVRSSSA